MMKALTLALALLLLCTGAALAKTPDGQTPAEEAVCDNETGAAFGLCNAYCEAMDCDSDSPQASDTACTKVHDKFMKITGRDLPCNSDGCPEPPPGTTCPCVDIMPAFVTALGSPGVCSDSGTQITKTTDPNSITATCSGEVTFCEYTDGVFGEGWSSTPEENTVCVRLIRASCAP